MSTQSTRISAYGLVTKDERILLCRLSKIVADAAGPTMKNLDYEWQFWLMFFIISPFMIVATIVDWIENWWTRWTG